MRTLHGMCLLFTVCITSVAFATQQAPKEPVAIKVPEGVTLKKPVVLFPHAKHATEACESCHHKLTEKPEIYACGTVGCHDGKGLTKEERKAANYFRQAYHGKAELSCNGCHRARKKVKKPAGPTKCKSCHVKK